MSDETDRLAQIKARRDIPGQPYDETMWLLDLVETLTAERDDLAAKVARVEALAESGVAAEAKAVEELEATVALVREYAKMRETYGKRGRSVHSSRIASDLFGIVGDDRAAVAGDGEH